MADQQELTQPQAGVGNQGVPDEGTAQQPTAQAGDARQPDGTQPTEQGQEFDYSKIDLDNVPAFREWKKKTDLRIAEAERRAQQQAAEAQRRAAEAERRAEEQLMSQMDDFERARYERDKYAQQLQEMNQQLEYQRAMQYKQQQLNRISQETGVPVEELDATNPDAAWQSALTYLKNQQNQSVQQQARELAQRQQANTVDLGGGSPQTTDARYRAQRQKIASGGGTGKDFFASALRQHYGEN